MIYYKCSSEISGVTVESRHATLELATTEGLRRRDHQGHTDVTITSERDDRQAAPAPQKASRCEPFRPVVPGDVPERHSRPAVKKQRSPSKRNLSIMEAL